MTSDNSVETKIERDISTYARTSWTALIWEREGETKVEDEVEKEVEEEGRKGERIWTVKPRSQSKLFHKNIEKRRRNSERNKKNEEKKEKNTKNRIEQNKTKQ